MNDHYHAVVWIDHSEAKVFFVEASSVDQLVVRSHATGRHLQHKANVTGGGHRGVDREYFKRVAEALNHSGAILITGPSHAKLELRNFLTEHYPDLAKRVSAVEALDHPSDKELVALARKFFKADDRMHAQRV
jgi:stalled ribosome rescue protein Dom34